MEPLFTFGDLVLDVVATVEGGLDRDTDTPGEVRSAPGGSAANFAVWTARLGDPVRFAGRVGDDLLGRALADDMRREGVEAHIALDPVHPTAVLVLFSDGSQRHMMVPRGANHHLDAEDLPAELIRSAGWLHVTGYSFFWEGPRRAAAKAMAIAREAGVPISLDPASAGFIRRYGLPHLDRLKLLLPNREEAVAMTGLSDLSAAALRLGEQAELVAVKLGPEGALLALGGKLIPVAPARPDGPVVDATGAGDAWGAAFIHGLRTGLEPVEAARRANRLGARLVTRIGARPLVPLD
ncbi:MAG: carbohydrate kinase family protein [Bacillota bacterium]